MKRKHIFAILIIVPIVISMVSLGLNIYFLATRPFTASSIFNMCQNSIIEIKAETESIGTSYGTGEIIAEDGTIVTNAHVITYTKLSETYLFETIFIRFVDEEDYRQVDVVKYDIEQDIAVLKLNNTGRVLKPIKIGDDSKLKVGDKVYAVGNMSNYGLSLTQGVVSIPHINVSYNNIVRNVIQCDLTISDGNSGGALINSNGELIGLTTFRLKDKSNNIVYGISYCIPISVVMEYVGTN